MESASPHLLLCTAGDGKYFRISAPLIKPRDISDNINSDADFLGER